MISPDAAFDVETAQAEVAFHKEVELAEIGWPEEAVTYDDYLADFSGEFHDIRGDPAFTLCLDADSYVASQALAEQLLAEGSLGIAYPSVRRPPPAGRLRGLLSARPRHECAQVGDLALFLGCRGNEDHD